MTISPKDEKPDLDDIRYFDEELIEEAIVEVEVDGNTFKCLLCGQIHELSDKGWKVDEEFFELPMKSFACTQSMYYVFAKTDEGIINFMYGLDWIPIQDGELK